VRAAKVHVSNKCSEYL